MSDTIRKALILARGLGTRMQKADASVKLDDEAARAADSGLKVMMPVGGRPYLDYAIQNLLDAGLNHICMVVPPGDSPMRDYYGEVFGRLEGADLEFAVQDEPRGTADAVKAGRDFAGGDDFVMVNADNVYSTEDLNGLRLKPPGECWVVGYTPYALTQVGNLPPERVARMAVVQMDPDWNLLRIVEKPDRPEDYAVDGQVYVSMNLFRFGPAIFEACDNIEPHPVRGEYEITTAVQYVIEHSLAPFRVLLGEGTVIDMSARMDVESVRRHLAGRQLDF